MLFVQFNGGKLVVKKAMRPVLSLVFAVVALLGGTGVASADVIVPPGGSGNICSSYAYLSSSPAPNRYFQTCAWVNSTTVWFTINFGNASDTTMSVLATLGYWQTGTYHECFHNVQINVPAHSTLATSKPSCDFNRAHAAYQAYAYVEWPGVAASRTSDTIQVQ